MDLSGKIALVTGGTRGIGRAISMELAQSGATVVVNYRRKKSTAEEFAGFLENEGLSYRLVKANIEEEDDIDLLTGAIADEFGRIDILVSNAVFGAVKPFTEITSKLWDKTMNTNAHSLLRLARKMAEMPDVNGGSIIAVSSLGGRRVIRDYSVVGVSKAALEAVVRYLAVELAPSGYRANAIAPGVVETEALSSFPDSERMISEAKEKTPLGRLTSPEDVARLALFLAGGESGMITGQVITVDGGYSLPV